MYLAAKIFVKMLHMKSLSLSDCQLSNLPRCYNSIIYAAVEMQSINLYVAEIVSIVTFFQISQQPRRFRIKNKHTKLLIIEGYFSKVDLAIGKFLILKLVVRSHLTLK